MIARLELEAHGRRALRALAWLALALPLAVAGVLALALLVVALLLAVTIVGLPALLVAEAAARLVLRGHRRAANRLLGTQILPLAGPAPREGGPWRRGSALLSDPALWRSAAALAGLAVLTVALAALVLVPGLLLVEALRLGMAGVGGLGGPDFFGPWSFGPGVGLALLVLAVPAAVLLAATLELAGDVAAAAARALLAARAAPAGPVREMLAESLGDRSVSIAYWLPDREAFVDETGRRVELPQPGSGRAWTAVERDGQRVAAIVHDAALDTSRELVGAVAAGSSLALDNERLKADLRARLEELRVSRLRIVEATDDARRRIERDLHDGAQQELVALALELRLIRSRLADPDTVALVDRVAERLATALEELRELARGIHPAILTDRGLAPAVEALAGRSPVPVRADVAITERLPRPVEAAAYFVVAEGLTNVAKYARADVARVIVRRHGSSVVVRVEDDGVGGVDVHAGSGLRGLQDRLAAVGGTLVIESPAGRGTRVQARIPCPPDELDEARGAPEEVAW